MQDTENRIAKRKTWEKTKTQFLVRHCSGQYYAIAYANGKQIWRSLRTKHYSIAQARLAEFLKDHRRTADGNGKSEISPKLTFAEALRIHQRNQADNVQIKPATLHYWNQIFAKLLKSWPEIRDREIRRITATDCEEWARKFRKIVSPTRWNNTLSGLRHVFEVALRGGIIHRNPAATPADHLHSPLRRLRPNKKKPDLPTRAEFFQLVETVEKAGGGCSRHCADFLRGLAFTGVRKGEAAQIEWRDLEFDRGEIVVRGDPDTATKNWEVRRVPMIPDARTLFERMRSARAAEPFTEKVFRVRESQKAIDHACRKLGLRRITHHDLRHLFATTCIESGTDIRTLASWLGHRDGGALALKTYGHLRNEHSVAQAGRVSFQPNDDAANKVVNFSEA
jgi:integrase